MMLVGRMANEVELDQVDGNRTVINFQVADNRFGKAADKQKADFFNCVAWNNVAKRFIKIVEKGDLVCIIGKVETGNYLNKENGKIQYTYKIIVDDFQLLSKKREFCYPITEERHYQ